MRRPADTGFSAFSALLLAALLQGCVGFEPAQLVPSLDLSPENLQLGQVSSGSSAGADLGLQVTTNESDSLFNLEALPGVRVREVSPGGPAAAAGITPGDVILAVDGTQTNQPDSLTALLAATTPGSTLEVSLRRGTAVLAASLVTRTTASAGSLRELYRIDPVATRAGYRSEAVSVRGRPALPAARIVELLDASPLAAAGLQVDDLVLALDGRELGSAQDLITRLHTEHALGDTVSLTVYRDSRILEQEVRLWDPGRRLSQLSLRPLLHYDSSLNPERTTLSLLDFWLFSVYRYTRSEGERQHQLLELFRITSDYGELVEEPL